jgi:hypothetical protein
LDGALFWSDPRHIGRGAKPEGNLAGRTQGRVGLSQQLALMVLERFQSRQENREGVFGQLSRAPDASERANSLVLESDASALHNVAMCGGQLASITNLLWHFARPHKTSTSIPGRGSMPMLVGFI